MDNCCYYNPGPGDSGDPFVAVKNIRIVTLKEEHQCFECGEMVSAGKEMEKTKMVHVTEGGKECQGKKTKGHYFIYTCIPCMRIRQDMLCDQNMRGYLRDAILECKEFDYVTGLSAKMYYRKMGGKLRI